MNSNVVSQRFVKCINKIKDQNIIRSSRQFAMALDYLPQSLSEIIQGRRDAPLELLRKAIESFGFHPVYLFTGKEPMLMAEEIVVETRMLTVVTDSLNEHRIVHVPAMALEAYSTKCNEHDFLQALPTFSLPDVYYRVGKYRAFEVVGEAMNPLLYEGETVICSYMEPENWQYLIKDTQVYVVVSHKEVLLRRVLNRLATSGDFHLSGLHPNFTDLRIPEKEIKEIWHVKAKISPFQHFPPALPSATSMEIMQEIKTLLSSQASEIAGLRHLIQHPPISE